MDKILTHDEIQHKVRRISYQIFESNADEDEIIIAGIEGGGLKFAKKIVAVLDDITNANIILCKVKMEREYLKSYEKSMIYSR